MTVWYWAGIALGAIFLIGAVAIALRFFVFGEKENTDVPSLAQLSKPKDSETGSSHQPVQESVFDLPGVKKIEVERPTTSAPLPFTAPVATSSAAPRRPVRPDVADTPLPAQNPPAQKQQFSWDDEL